MSSATEQSRIELWHDALWAGYSEQAVAALNKLRYAEQPNIRRRANWVLGRWYASAGHYAEASYYFHELVRNEPYVYAKATVALAFCALMQDQRPAIQTLLQSPHYEKPSGFDNLCLHFNACDPAIAEQSARRLALLNAYFEQHQLAAIQLRSGKTLASLAHLDGDTPEARQALQAETTPLVSVVVPAYNAARTIQTALDSLLAQEWPNLEIIVVNDASQDDTAAQVEQLVQRHSCIRLVNVAANAGAYAARNTGMKLATGDFVTVHDADDWSHPAKIRLQVEALQANAEAHASVSFWTRVDESFNMLGLWMVGGRFVELNHSSALFRRSVLEHQGAWLEVRASADTEYLWRLQAWAGEKALVEVLPEVPLSFSLVHRQSLTQQASTHVRTIYNGVRRLYRDAVKVWHRDGGNYLHWSHSHDTEHSAPFVVPEGLKHQPQRDFADLWLVDASVNNTELESILAGISAQLPAPDARSKPVAVMLWYQEFEHALVDISPDFYRWLQRYQLALIHPGMHVSVERVIFTQAQQLQQLPDALPALTSQSCWQYHEFSLIEMEPQYAAMLQALLAQGLRAQI